MTRPSRPAGQSQSRETATFGAGCFWGVEAAFRRVNGVVDTTVGYAGGHTTNPTYDQVCRGNTGHAEVTQVVFDPTVVSYVALLEEFFALHDPTTRNRQGPDVGEQYRSLILYHLADQATIARAMIERLNISKKFSRPIVTEVAPLKVFYPAEDYHQDYYQKSGRRE